MRGERSIEYDCVSNENTEEGKEQVGTMDAVGSGRLGAKFTLVWVCVHKEVELLVVQMAAFQEISGCSSCRAAPFKGQKCECMYFKEFDTSAN